MTNGLLVVYGITLGVLVLLWLLMRLLSGGSFSLRRLITGKDGGLSVSQFQATIWTVVVIAAYVAVYTANFWWGKYDPAINIPNNLLILAGLSYVTYVGATAITRSQLAAGVKAATGVTPPPGAFIEKESAHTGTGADLVSDEANQTDLTKLQLIAWTLIAAVIFLLGLHNNLDVFLHTPPVGPPPTFNFPELDTTLLALAGLGQATYLGKKALIDQAVPTPAALEQFQAAAAQPVAVVVLPAPQAAPPAGDVAPPAEAGMPPAAAPGGAPAVAGP